MSMIRTFHPVGQGAFYSERHVSGKNKFTIVYDCGSLKPKGENLERVIKQSFRKGEKIDVLFISHFHEDHTNGIETLVKHCKIKTVVIPYLDEELKRIHKIKYCIDHDMSIKKSNNLKNFYLELIDNPEGIFKKAKFIRIKNVSKGNAEQLNMAPKDFLDLEEQDKQNSVVHSGIRIRSSKIKDWVFVPFNYDSEKKKKEFAKKLSEKELLENLQNFDDDKWRKVETICRAIFKNYVNDSSMILFSGTNKADIINISRNHCSVYCLSCTHPCCTIQSGCLYLGDLNLKGHCKQIMGKLAEFKVNIGTIQIPHHGSKHNFDKNIISQNMKCAVVSYGTENGNGHPSDKVVGEVVSNGLMLFSVTENPCSMFMQFRTKTIATTMTDKK